MKKVMVKSGARLHLGFYSFRVDSLGRAYGGVGVSVEEPFVEVEVYPSDKVEIEVTDESIEELVKEVIEALGAKVRVRVTRCIPRHVGLGSTTQLVLSLAYAISKLEGFELDPWVTAAAFGRGPISGIGIATFLYGGLVVDSGTKLHSLAKYPALDPEDLPKPIARIELPKDWRFVVVIPKGIRGLSEREEMPLLTCPQPLDPDKSRELLEEVFLRMLPAAVRGDAKEFGYAVTRIQTIVGEYFSKHQGGVFAKPYGEVVARALRSCGSLCIGQSSWGPAMYGLAPSPEEGEKLRACVSKELDREGVDAYIVSTPPRNKGFEFISS